jgi:hypothetical protein
MSRSIRDGPAAAGSPGPGPGRPGRGPAAASPRRRSSAPPGRCRPGRSPGWGCRSCSAPAGRWPPFGQGRGRAARFGVRTAAREAVTSDRRPSTRPPAPATTAPPATSTPVTRNRRRSTPTPVCRWSAATPPVPAEAVDSPGRAPPASGTLPHRGPEPGAGSLEGADQRWKGVEEAGAGAGEGGGRPDGAKHGYPGQSQPQPADGQQPDGHREPGQHDGDPGQHDELVALAEGPDGELLEPLRGGVDRRAAHRDQRRRLRTDESGQQLGHPECGSAGQQPGHGPPATPAGRPGSRGGGRRDRPGAHAPCSEPPGPGIGLDPASVG